MTAPTYRLFAFYNVTGGHLGHYDWEVTDGIGGPLLASGRSRTKRGAERAAADAAASCEEAIESRLERVRTRLAADGVRVDVRLDEQGRVCVHPACACSDVDHRRVMRAFLAIAGAVRWEVSA
ncbi:hypothetical protein [Actinoplanes lobatus]|uniref:Uncharacterized protein n=1 Tax=Actinoplanes lobatus TaxID=113568 RepID=A0A7W7HRJ6_9ACTN|nr:hypothetical protein [Actinoplanes lobatus]MBB4755334.1 hypothetical protein [Actinoplanes lobatus]GIE46392.1 hypothetical protein Alo02nite_92900 [Actinoplanes lobatus]